MEFMDEVQNLIKGMSDEELAEALSVKLDHYTLEALELAKKEADLRGIDLRNLPSSPVHEPSIAAWCPSYPIISTKSPFSEMEPAEAELPEKPNFRWRIGKLWGFPIFLHLSMLLWLIGIANIKFLGFLAILIPSILLHEIAHAIVCKQTGGGKGTITIWALGGYFIPMKDFQDPSGMSPKERWSGIGYIVAGPLMNLLLAAGFYILGLQYKVGWFLNVSELNLGLGILNLFPVYPLDGGQILFMIGTARFPRQKLTVFLGLFALLVGVLLGVYQFTHVLERNILTRLSSSCGIFLGFGIRTLKESGKTDEEYQAEIETAIRRERKIAGITE